MNSLTVSWWSALYAMNACQYIIVQKFSCMLVLGTTTIYMILANFKSHFFFFPDTCCLRDLVLSLPPAASLGQTVILNCSFHLQGEDLYAIKLYKGRNEFVQFVPDRQTPLKIFPLKGVHITVSLFIWKQLLKGNLPFLVLQAPTMVFQTIISDFQFHAQILVFKLQN